MSTSKTINHLFYPVGNDDSLCLNCKRYYSEVHGKSCKLVTIPDKIPSDPVTGRALPGHPGLA